MSTADVRSRQGLSRRVRTAVDPIAYPAAVFSLLLIVLGIASGPAFSGAFNVSNILLQVTPLLMIAIGQTFAIATGGLDLSVGSTASLSAVVTATLMQPLGPPLACLVGLCAGLAVGLINGLAVASGFEAFLTTLATLSIAQGAALFVRPTPGGEVPPEFGVIAGFWNNLPVALPIVLLAAAAAAFYLRRTRTGSDILSVGGDPGVSRLAGINVKRAYLTAYLICSGFAALAGIYLVARTQTGDPIIGGRFALDSLAAVVVGGSLLAGGRVTLAGTVFGALALGLVSNVMNLWGVPTFYQNVAKGLILIAAILLPTLIGAATERSRRRASARLAIG
ncbi:MAG: ABC transporter permease [Propionicimonas sp.]|jgi:ribose/xylose/arabinose/galactoside ABC-type transport system permease subunit